MNNDANEIVANRRIIKIKATTSVTFEYKTKMTRKKIR